METINTSSLTDRGRGPKNVLGEGQYKVTEEKLARLKEGIEKEGKPGYRCGSPSARNLAHDVLMLLQGRGLVDAGTNIECRCTLAAELSWSV